MPTQIDGIFWEKEEFDSIIENPEFTKEILEYFARDEIGFPANETYRTLHKNVFPEKSEAELLYHLSCCFDNGLLHGELLRSKALDGNYLGTGYIDGLTAKGGDYVRNSQTRYWDQACAKIKEVGVNMTTSNIIGCLNSLVEQALKQ